MPYYLAPLWDATVAARGTAEAKKRETQKNRSQATQATGKVPKELREKLKKTKAARGLLQDLEEQVRSFVKEWEEKKGKPPPAPRPELDSEDEEIVFIGRNGRCMMSHNLRTPQGTILMKMIYEETSWSLIAWLMIMAQALGMLDIHRLYISRLTFTLAVGSSI